MTKRKNILAAMVGLAMLAMPVSALAKDHHGGNWNNPRPQAWHDQGKHNGWFKNQGNQGWHDDGWSRNHRDRDDYRPGWNGNNYYQPPAAWHHEPDRDDYGYNGGNGYNGGYEYNGGYGNGGTYGTPYYGKSLAQLMVDRQNEYRTYMNLLNQHDSRGASRYFQQVLGPTNRRIAALNGGYVPPAAAYNNGYYGNNGLVGGLLGNNGYYGNNAPYGNGGYYGNNGYSGNNGYYGNNPMGGLGALVGPLLGMTP
jgi:hypothetical protein